MSDLGQLLQRRKAMLGSWIMRPPVARDRSRVVPDPAPAPARPDQDDVA